MAIKLEKVVEKFYQYLEEGKIMGRKCPACGNMEFPPVLACNKCGNYETEWAEISGKAVMKSCVLPAALSSKPEYATVLGKKYCYAEIELEEGSLVNGVVLGVNKKKRKELVLPAPVKAAIVERQVVETANPDQPIKYKTVVFELVEE
ncbi:MAG: hypothetical protein HUJ76_10645 [Parasporobacterium sp.]|nr:hypothetical protein [Parasporobacterium sp.]